MMHKLILFAFVFVCCGKDDALKIIGYRTDFGEFVIKRHDNNIYEIQKPEDAKILEMSDDKNQKHYFVVFKTRSGGGSEQKAVCYGAIYEHRGGV
jgi:hypothetical protein